MEKEHNFSLNKVDKFYFEQLKLMLEVNIGMINLELSRKVRKVVKEPFDYK